VENEEQIEYPSIALGAHPDSGAPVVVRIGKFGPYVQIGQGDDAINASVPEETPPADFTLETAIQLVEARAQGPASLGTDPASGLAVYLMTGRFGPYVQLGETPEKGGTDKPRRASLTRDDTQASITLQRALELLSLPRLVGRDPDSGEEVTANFGRFGPYVKRGDEFRSLASDAAVFEVTLDEALELLRQEKRSRRTASRTVLRELGTHPASGAVVQLIEGRYGPYVTDGTTNASLPKDMRADEIALDRAVELLNAREGAPKKGGRPRSTAARRPGTTRRATKGRPTARKRQA
jgi:DNA topoisomerase-1